MGRQIHLELAQSVTPLHSPSPYYAQDLATVFPSFYKQCRVVSPNEELTKARLKLVRATQIVLPKALGLMGMTSPEKM
jgi:arginyl-tRNA synthetase